MAMHVTLAELAHLLDGELVGDGQTIVSRVRSLEQAQAGDLTFLADPNYLPLLARSRASAVLVMPHIPVDRPAIRVADPYLGFIRVLETFFAPHHPLWGIDARAVLAPNVVVGPYVNIAPYVVIAQGVRLGKGVTVYPGTYIGAECDIGDHCVLYANVSLYARVRLGQGVIIHSGAVIGADGFGFHPLANGSYQKIPQVGGVIIGDEVEIGANACIDRAMIGDTIIETGVKLDNLTQIGHNCVIGAHTVMAGQAGIAGSVRVGSRVRLGGQAGITDHVTIGDDVAIMAQSGVATDVAAETTVFGSPAVPASVAKRTHFYSQRLGELFRHVKRLQRRVEELEKREKRA